MRKKWDRGKGLNCINSTIRRNADNKKTSENQGFRGFDERRRPDLNRWILVLQTIALPLGYVAVFIFYVGWEPVSRVLQTHALPLGYVAVNIVKSWSSNEFQL